MPEQMIRIPRSIGPLKIRPPSSDEQEGRPKQHLGNSPVESVAEKDMTLELLTEFSPLSSLSVADGDCEAAQRDHRPAPALPLSGGMKLDAAAAKGPCHRH